MRKKVVGNFGKKFMNSSDEIKSKLDIVDVIRDYIPLKAAGVNFRALCPFHHEKSPSFIVSPEKQIWHCFGCGKGGDVISFVMEIEGLSFIEALRHLAPRAGVELKRQDPKITSQRNRVLDIIEFSKNYYYQKLIESPLAESARNYLAERGITDEALEKWQIGYSPESWDDLIIFLKGKGFMDNEIFLAGLSVKKENGSGFYNRFRGRIMFPINDVNGSVVAFSARVLPEKEITEKLGKYINSPQTLVYDKSRILFGLDKAKREIKNKDSAIIVEGQMDAITAHENGFANVVASSGTALTNEQVALLKRYSNNISLSFDADKAGDMASERGISAALKAGMNARVIILLNGKDPDECIKKDKPGWEKAIAEAKPVMQYYFDKTFIGLDLSGAEDRALAVKKLLPIIAELGNKMESDFWLKKLSEQINAREETLYEEMQKYFSKDERTKVPENTKEQKIIFSREEVLSEIMLALIIKFPLLVEYALNRLEPDQVAISSRRLYKAVLNYYNNLIDNWTRERGSLNADGWIPQINYADFRSWIEGEEEMKNELRNLEKLALLGDRDFYNYDSEKAKIELTSIIKGLKKIYLLNRRNEIKKMISQGEEEKDEENVKGLFEELKLLNDEVKELGD